MEGEGIFKGEGKGMLMGWVRGKRKGMGMGEGKDDRKGDRGKRSGREGEIKRVN